MNRDSRLRIDTAGLLEDAIGESGIARREVLALAPRLGEFAPRLRDDPPPFLALPFAGVEGEIGSRARKIADRFRRTVVLGIGGSSLGGEMLAQALGPRPARHPVIFCDNVDPDTLALQTGDAVNDTHFLVISKAGNTAETLAQFLSLLPRLEANGATRLAERVTVITENPHGALALLARQLRLDILPHPPVGGRFSVLSVVGLLPAAIAGADIEGVLAGARAMAEQCRQPDIERNPALFNAGAQYLHAQRGRALSVHWAYSDRLLPVTQWLRQLWGESLGKRDAAGRPQGLTPVPARGVTDQHSQLQLYLDGPDDKQFTFFTDPTLRDRGRRVPERFTALPAVAALAGHTTGELLHAELGATRETLARHGRPHRVIALAPEPVALGELIVLLETETVATAELLRVNAYDQPAVEEGKRLAREYLKKEKS
jgi:glucose-6-phosphate isomerase